MIETHTHTSSHHLILMAVVSRAIDKFLALPFKANLSQDHKSIVQNGIVLKNILLCSGQKEIWHVTC